MSPNADTKIDGTTPLKFDKITNRNLGCLGAIWIMGLIMFSGIGGWFLHWQSPSYLEALQTIGKPKPVIDIYVSGDEFETDISEAITKPIEPKILAIEDLAQSVEYTADYGVNLIHKTGASFVFPPGSLNGPMSIEATPVMSIPTSLQDPTLRPIGMSYRLRFDGEDHMMFNTPVTVTLPLDLGESLNEIDTSKIVVTTFAEGKWETHPARYNSQNKTVTAQTPHASVTGLALLAAGVTTLFSETGRAIVQRANWERLDKTGWLTHKVMKTTNFAIHYSDTGGYQVPQNAAFPLPLRNPNNPHPAFVQEIGACLEEGYKSLSEVGMPYSSAFPNRWSVFLQPDPVAFGNTNLGGPIYLDNNYTASNNDGSVEAVRYRLWATCLHEMIHVAQDNFFNGLNVDKSWMEITAEYLSNKLMEKKGMNTAPYKNYYIKSNLNLPIYSFADCNGAVTCNYDYAYFFYWLDKKGFNSTAIIEAVNKAGGPGTDIKRLKRALRAETRKDFETLWLAFTQDYYHDNLYSGDTTGMEALAQDFTQNFKNPTFYPLTYQSRRGKKKINIIISSKDTASGQVVPRSAQHHIFTAKDLDIKKRAKLVIHTPNKNGFIYAYAASGYDPAFNYEAGGNFSLPLTSRMTDLEPFDSAKIGDFWTVPFFGRERNEEGEGTNFASIVLTNPTALNAGKGDLRRWLLLPPEELEWNRHATRNEVIIEWAETPLKSKAKNNEFAGYNIYRLSLIHI